MKLRFRITVKSSAEIVATFDGREVDSDHLTVTDVHEGIIHAEQFLERLTGLRVHIEQVE